MRPVETLPTQGASAQRINALLSARLSDERLARRIGAGDHAAFEVLYGRYSTRLAAYGSRLLGDRARGEDVSQTTLMNAYQALLRGSRPTHVKAWLYRSARNAALELLRRQKDTRLLVESDLEGTDSDENETHATRGQLVKALRALPARQRRAYLLREMYGLPIKEIGERLELSVEQIEQALFAARNRLAEELVFGERLTCDTVQALDPALLHGQERRALRGHLRACSSCRSTVSVGGALAGFSPLGLIASLRSAAGSLLGGSGAPLAVKAGAVVATAALAGGGVGVAKIVDHHRARVQRGALKAAAPLLAPGHAGSTEALLARVFLNPLARSAGGGGPRPASLAHPTPVPVRDPGTTTAPTTTSATDAIPTDPSSDPTVDPAAEATTDPSAVPAADPPPDPSAPETTPTDTTPTDTTAAVDTTATDTTPADSTPTDTTAAP